MDAKQIVKALSANAHKILDLELKRKDLPLGNEREKLADEIQALYAERTRLRKIQRKRRGYD